MYKKGYYKPGFSGPSHTAGMIDIAGGGPVRGSGGSYNPYNRYSPPPGGGFSRMGRVEPQASGGLVPKVPFRTPSSVPDNPWSRRMRDMLTFGKEVSRFVMEGEWGAELPGYNTPGETGLSGFEYVTTRADQVGGCGAVQEKWTLNTVLPAAVGCTGGFGVWNDPQSAATSSPWGGVSGIYLFNTWSMNTLFLDAEPKDIYRRIGAGNGAPYTIPGAYIPLPSAAPLTPAKGAMSSPRGLAARSPYVDEDGRPFQRPYLKPSVDVDLPLKPGGPVTTKPGWHAQLPGRKEKKRNGVPPGFFLALTVFHAATEACDFFGAVADGLQGVRVHRSRLGGGTAQTSSGCTGDILYAIDNFKNKMFPRWADNDWSVDGRVLADILWNIGENAVMDRALGKLMGAKWTGSPRGWDDSYSTGVSTDAAIEAAFMTGY